MGVFLLIYSSYSGSTLASPVRRPSLSLSVVQYSHKAKNQDLNNRALCLIFFLYIDIYIYIYIYIYIADLLLKFVEHFYAF